MLLLFCIEISILHSLAELKGKFSLEPQNTNEPVLIENRKAQPQLNITLNVMDSLTRSALKTSTFKQKYHQHRIRKLSGWKKRKNPKTTKKDKVPNHNDGGLVKTKTWNPLLDNLVVKETKVVV